MQFIVNGDEVSKNPTPQLVTESIENMKAGDGSFVILANGARTFIQAATNRDGGFVIEYQDGSNDKHYQSVDLNIESKTVRDVFLSYLESDNSWRSRVIWKQIDLGSGILKNKFYIAFLIAGMAYLFASYIIKFWRISHNP